MSRTTPRIISNPHDTAVRTPFQGYIRVIPDCDRGPVRPPFSAWQKSPNSRPSRSHCDHGRRRRVGTPSYGGTGGPALFRSDDSLHEEPQGIAGWLLVYVIALAFLVVHGLGLTVGAIIIYSNPSIAGLHTFIPLAGLLYYVLTNIAGAVYTVVLFTLMVKKRHSAIANNIAFNILSASIVVSWHLMGAKSPVGTVVDVLPYLVGLCYFLTSKRVRNTFREGMQC